MMELGAILTLLAWVGLQLAVVHGKYVVDKIAVSEYQKGPLDRPDGDESS